jgi:hypothetical protein
MKPFTGPSRRCSRSGFFRSGRQGSCQCLAHRSPVHTQLARHRSDRAFTMLKLPSDLLE